MTNYHQSLRTLMYFLKDDCLLSQGDLADGLGISRTVINKYFKEEKYTLPISRENLINLYKYIQQVKDPTKKNIADENLNDEDKEKKINDAIKYRRKLSSPDEFLEAAGYLPEKNKSVQVSPDIFQMVLEIARMLEFLTVEEAQNLSFDFKSIIHHKLKLSGEKSKDTEFIEKPLDEYIENRLKKTKLPLSLVEQSSIINKVKKIKKKLAQKGKSKFTEQEAITLLFSICVKEKMAKDLEDISLRLEKIEYNTLSFSIDSEDKFKELHQRIWGEIARQEEWELAGYEPNEEDRKMLQEETFDDCNPVLMARLTCILRYGSEVKKLIFIYMSSNTILENSFAAIGLNLGFSEELGNVDFLSTKVLSSKKNGLIETTVILKEDNKYYQATWVDLDTILAKLQAALSAAVQWLSCYAQSPRDESLNLENYQSLCLELSKIREDLFISRSTLNNFQFLDHECDDSTITKIVDTAINQLKKLQEQSYLGVKRITEVYRRNFYRCYFHAQTIRLRKFNTQGNIRQIKEILDNIENTQKEYLNADTVKNNFATLIALKDIEQYLYEFSTGFGWVFNSDDEAKKKQWLEETVEKIQTSIKSDGFYKDVGLDVHQSLSEVYGNIARFYFYLSDDKYTLSKARENFLRAAYHASRIGATRRTAKWITFAGRVNVRLGNRNKDNISIEQYISLGETIINKGVSAEYQPIFKDALLSEIRLLRGELHLIKKEYEQAFKCFLLALKGSIYLGFNRRISDSLYNLHRCSKKLGGISIKALIEQNFKDIIIPNRDIPELNKIQLNPQNNIASEAAIDLLNNYLQNSQNSKNNESFQNNPNIYLIPTDTFLSTAKGIWTQWHKEWKNSHPNINDNLKINSQHPVVILMDEGKWLSILED